MKKTRFSEEQIIAATAPVTIRDRDVVFGTEHSFYRVRVGVGIVDQTTMTATGLAKTHGATVTRG